MSEHDPHDPLDPKVWDAWPDAPPPTDFVEKVLAARRGAPEERRPSRRIRHAILGGIVALAVLVAILVVAGSTPRPAGGERTLAARDTIAIGLGAVAVAEAGSTLAWRARGTGLVVRQDRGDVFYRVEKGTRFEVETPLGRVSVAGTCFRVALASDEEVMMRPNKQVLGGAAVGAVAAATLMVVVYEGAVRVENGRGDTLVKAGETARVEGDRAPVLGEGGLAAQLPDLGEPPAGASRDELLQRDRVQRDQIAALKVRLGRLEGDLARAGKGEGGPGGPREMFDLGPEELKAMAARCEIRYALPGFRPGESAIDTRRAERLGLSTTEASRVNEILTKQEEQFLAQVRALYLEATGDATGAETLELHAMEMEIEHKSADTDAIRKKIAEERAGLRPPPTDPRAGSAYERYLRLALSVGPELERALTRVVGEARMRELRDGVLGARHIMQGCPGED